MTHSGYFKEFCRYVSLNVLGMIALSCYILADTFFVSKGLGTNGLAALNLAIPVYSFISGSGLMFGMGGATKFSISKSQGDTARANQAFTNTLFLVCAFAAVFFLTGLFFSRNIVELLGADEAVFQMTQTYLRVILLFAPMFMMNNVLLCFVRNDGAPQLSMAAMIGGSLSNIVLDYVFIFPFGMVIFGAVLATGFAPVISMLILSPFFLKKKNTFRPVKCIPGRRLMADIFSGGFPSLLSEVSSGIVIIIFNMLILGLEGNTGVAAYGVIANLSLVVISVYTGIAQGVQPILSKSYGHGDRPRIQSVFRYALITAAAFSVAVYTVIFFNAAPIADIFNSEGDPLLAEIAVGGLRLYFTGCLFAGLNIILSVYFTSTEYPLPAHVISLCRGFLVIIPLAFLLSKAAGMTGIWLTFPLAEMLVCILAVVLYLRSPKGAVSAAITRR